MNSLTSAVAMDLGHAPSGTLRDFVTLTKPRVVVMVLITAAVGFYLAVGDRPDYRILLLTLIGTGLAAGGTLALNQYIERDLDRCMKRTCDRPLPSGRLQPLPALVFGASLVAAGLLLLAAAVSPLSAAVTAFTTATYLFAYTPLKRRTPLCMVVGAIPGALPPVTGWAAGAGDLGAGAWVLFAILFLWQLPHSLAVARLYADDYARAGFRLLPVVDREGNSTERQIVANCIALLAVGLMPTVLGLTGPLYFVCAFVLGSGFLLCGVWSAVFPSPAAARRLLVASLLYLPALLAFMAADKVPL